MVRLLIVFLILNFLPAIGLQAKSQNETLKKYKSFANYLNDPKNLISKNFKAHPDIMPRVHFWFNVYTKYSSKDHILHHTLHPWIVYEVINTEHFFIKFKNKITAQKHANTYVKERKLHYKKIINRLARLRYFKKISAEDKSVLTKIKYLGKDFKTQLWIARRLVRSQTGQNDFFHDGVVASSEYTPYIQTILKEQGVPEELSSLPLVESSFNVNAKSKVGASGIWQIMPPTGRQYGIVNRTIDERNSPLKATLIAAKLLKFNYKQLNNWPLAITAYNNGVGNIKKSLRRAKTKDPYSLMNNHRRGAFGFASANFYASFIAALYTNKYSHDIFKIKKLKPLALEAVFFKNRTSLRHIIRHTGISLKKIKEHNLDLKKKVSLSTILPRKFKLFLPIGSSKKLLNKNTYLVKANGDKVNSDSKNPRS